MEEQKLKCAVYFSTDMMTWYTRQVKVKIKFFQIWGFQMFLWFGHHGVNECNICMPKN